MELLSVSVAPVLLLMPAPAPGKPLPPAVLELMIALLTVRVPVLLELLMRHPRQVLSRTRIYENVWDERYDGLSNTLEVHVMELRRKLEQHGDRLIHTVRGRGYRVETFAEAGEEQSP